MQAEARCNRRSYWQHEVELGSYADLRSSQQPREVWRREERQLLQLARGVYSALGLTPKHVTLCCLASLWERERQQALHNVLTL